MPWLPKLKNKLPPSAASDFERPGAVIASGPQKLACPRHFFLAATSSVQGMHRSFIALFQVIEIKSQPAVAKAASAT